MLPYDAIYLYLIFSFLYTALFRKRPHMSDSSNQREFHNFWAFALHIVFNIGCILYTLLYNKPLNISTIFSTANLAQLYSSFIIVFTLIIVVILSYRYASKYFLETSIIMVSVISIVSPLYYNNYVPVKTFSIFENYPAIGSLTILRYLTVFSALTHWKDILYLATVLKLSAVLIARCIFPVVLGVILFATILISQVFVITYTDNLNLDPCSIPGFSMCLNAIWTFWNMIYALDVYVISLVYHKYTNNIEEQMITKALTNVLYSYGSIAYAGLTLSLTKATGLCLCSYWCGNNLESQSKVIRYCLYFIMLIVDCIEIDVWARNDSFTSNVALAGKGSFCVTVEDTDAEKKKKSFLYACMELVSYTLTIAHVGLLFCFRIMLQLDLQEDVVTELNPLCKLLLIPIIIFYLMIRTIYSSFLAVIHLQMESTEVNIEIYNTACDIAEAPRHKLDPSNMPSEFY